MLDSKMVKYGHSFVVCLKCFLYGSWFVRLVQRIILALQDVIYNKCSHILTQSMFKIVVL